MAATETAPRITEQQLVEICSEEDLRSLLAYPWISNFNSFDCVLRQWPPKSASTCKSIRLPEVPAVERNLALELATAIQAKEDLDKEFDRVKKDFSSRKENLLSEIGRLKADILYGQKNLPFA